MSTHRVTSEIHTENDNFSVESKKGNAISKFFFQIPRHLPANGAESEIVEFDEDGDFIIDRKNEGTLLIEHSISTKLQLVGLQVWRGAFLLADYILNKPKLFGQKTILELGSGVGLTSIVAGMVAREVICTDVNMGGILELIKENFERNKSYVKSEFCVMELNFLESNWSKELTEKLQSVSVILAADVIYDDVITDGFVRTLSQLLDSGSLKKTVYVALEKRFVFTVADLDSVAPMYEEFLRVIKRLKTNWMIEYIDIDFPQYFKYDRVKHLILMRIENV